jgi:hypothetical protein
MRRVDPGLLGKSQKQRLISGQILKDPGEKTGLARGGPNLGRAYPGNGKETAQPFLVAGNEGKRLHRQHFRRFSRNREVSGWSHSFAFP